MYLPHSIVLALTLLRAHAGLSSCQYGATVSSHLLEASVLYIDGNVVLRARLGDTAYLAEGLQCLEGGRAYLTGIQWQILQASEQQNCTKASVFAPGSEFLIPGGTHSTPGYQCTPEIYAANPWACAAGDLSGKFGAVNLGLHDLLSEVKKYRFLGGSESTTDPEGKLANTLSHSRITEEQHIFRDSLPIPDCQLDGKSIGFFCADGRLAGCGSFQSIEPDHDSFKHPWEAALRFVTNYPPPPACPAPKACPSSEKNVTPSNKNVADPGWTDRIGKEIGKVPDYVSSWWEDVKKKSREAWKAQM